MAPIVRYPRLPVFFRIGQPAHHRTFGTGTLITVRGCIVTVDFAGEERQLDFEEVITKPQAEEGWKDCYLHGANRRLEEGRWLWLIRSLCSERGEWGTFLRKWGIPRSSAHDLIQGFLQARILESLNPSGNRTELNLTPANAHAPDPAEILNSEREAVVRQESERRERDRQEHGPESIDWIVRIKLPEEVSEECREKYKKDGVVAKRYWVRAAYRFADREDELVSGSDDAQQDET